MTQNPFNEENYARNLELLAKIDPLTAARVEIAEITNKIIPVINKNGQPNLCVKKYGITNYFHEDNLENEYKNLITEEIETKGETLFIYGLGLGYIYDKIDEWLHANPKRTIVFIEDDIEVLYYFLHTERATKILDDKQIIIYCMDNISDNYTKLLSFLIIFANSKINYVVLPIYGLRKSEECFNIGSSILYNAAMMEGVIMEYLSGQYGYFKNFYRNIFYMPSSYLASGMFDKFTNIPAIICGAGPSINKNIDVLKNLRNKAVIFAGGSSLNVLNSFGVNPHFAVGVDPNKEQMHRLLTNDTYHIPYFYRPRVSHDAFSLIQGPKIYISGSYNSVAVWFEQEMGISIPFLDEGHNVINLCTELAVRMGFNPIIYVGMDLALTEVLTYAKGISINPLWLDRGETSRPYDLQEKDRKQTTKRLDIYGKVIDTKWDWLGESNWLNHYALNHPKLTMINATEGGIGFPPVPNIPLQLVSEMYLKKNYDMEGLVHAEIQNHHINLTMPQLIKLLTKLRSSFEKCIKCYREIINEKMTQLKNEPEDKIQYDTPTTILLETEIELEMAYESFLKQTESAYDFMQRSIRHYKKTVHPPFYEMFAKTKYLESCLELQLNLMSEAFQLYLHTPQSKNSPLSKRETDETEKQEGTYLFENGHLQIQDQSLQIDITDDISEKMIERQIKTSDSGSIKEECYYVEGKLHGPSRFYTSDGQLLSEIWFCRGSQEGKNLQYYLSGNVYAIKHYKNNKLHGPQRYYYENGQVSTSMEYQNGLIDGEVKTYTESGLPLREVHYQNGKRDGIERMWYPNGQLIMECQFDKGEPVGKARQWTPTGWLFREVTVHKFPDDFDSKIFAKDGSIVKKIERGVEDFSKMYESAERRVEEVENQINSMLGKIEFYKDENLKKIESSNPDMYRQILSLQKAKEEMDNYKKALYEAKMENLEKDEELKRKRREHDE